MVVFTVAAPVGDVFLYRPAGVGTTDGVAFVELGDMGVLSRGVLLVSLILVLIRVFAFPSSVHF